MKAIKDFILDFEVRNGLRLDTSYGTIKSEKGVLLNVTIGYRADEDYGWFEFYDEKSGGENWYAEGGLWFKGNNLIDYDGVFELPEFIVKELKDKGFDVSFVE